MNFYLVKYSSDGFKSISNHFDSKMKIPRNQNWSCPLKAIFHTFSCNLLQVATTSGLQPKVT